MPNNIVNLNYTSLYPHVQNFFNGSKYDNDLVKDFLRIRNKKRLIEERKKKLERLNELYE